MAVIFLCMLEMTFQYAYYADSNERNTDSHALLSLAALLSSARYSVSLVILLVVCMGYGIVKYDRAARRTRTAGAPAASQWTAGRRATVSCRPALGTTWNKVVMLGLLNFVFTTLYNAAIAAKGTDDNPEVAMVLFTIPLAVTLFVFISWVRAQHPAGAASGGF